MCRRGCGHKTAGVKGLKSVKSVKLEIRQGVAGRGVFTVEPILRGTHLIKYTGPFLRYAQTTPQTLALQIGPDLYLGASGGLDDCVNHSCQPNAGIIIKGTEVDLIAIADIAVGSEIFFDYSTTMDEDDFELDCCCGTPQCRGRVRDFKHLPAALRAHYAGLGIVPEYNLKHV